MIQPHDYVSPLIDACPASTSNRIDLIVHTAQITLAISGVLAVVILTVLLTRLIRHRPITTP